MHVDLTLITYNNRMRYMHKGRCRTSTKNNGVLRQDAHRISINNLNVYLLNTLISLRTNFP